MGMQPERWLMLVLAGALALAACSKSPTIKPPKIKGSEQIAPEYRYSDNDAVKKRVQVRDALGLATQRLVSGDLAEAEKQANRALRLDPGSVDAHTVLGVIASRRGDAARAGSHYRRAAELGPERGEALNNYGAWLCGNGRAAESLTYFDAAMRDPRYGDPAGALANAGTCALDAGQPGRAEADLRAALRLDAESPIALDAMARLLVERAQFFEARAFSQRRLAAAPATAAALRLAARIEQGLGDSNAAERYLQRLRTDFPSSQNLQPREASPP